MSRKRKPIPSFKSEAEEWAFWETHDSTEYVDWSRAERVRLSLGSGGLRICCLGLRFRRTLHRLGAPIRYQGL